MTPVMMLGALGGAGVLLVMRGLRPRPERLEVVARRALHAPTDSRAAEVRPRRALVDSVEATLRTRTTRDLRALGRSPERHVLDKLTVALSLAGLSAALGVLLRATGSAVPPGVLVIAAMVGLVGGFFLPDALLAREAEDRRRQFRFALSSYLDLVNVLLAGGAGVETALEATAQAGDGWAFEQLRNALLRARTMRRSPWSALAELGEELGIDELQELAGSIQLAGEEGARIRSSLAARAASLRSRQLTQIEADANSASERMGVPTVAMFMGFLALLAYPAIQQIAGS